MEEGPAIADLVSGEDFFADPNEPGQTSADLEAPPPAAEEPLEPAEVNLPREDDDTTVLRVCRNELNTINTHPTGFHWFSA